MRCCSAPMRRKRPSPNGPMRCRRISPISSSRDSLDRLESYIEDAIAPRADPGQGRHAEGDQRADPLFARRQSLYRPGPWADAISTIAAASASASPSPAGPARPSPNGSPMASRNGISGRSIRGATPTTRPRPMSSPRRCELYQNEYAIAFPGQRMAGGPPGQDHGALRQAESQGRHVRRPRRLGARRPGSRAPRTSRSSSPASGAPISMTPWPRNARPCASRSASSISAASPSW